MNTENTDSEFEQLFINWVREAFQVKKKPEFLKNIVFWAKNIADWNREKQKNLWIIVQKCFDWLCSKITEAKI
ncbi:hypothetical protein LDL59_08090 [Kaistella anthropi]|nr:hypothetical protein [Kaistella anthropi]